MKPLNFYFSSFFFFLIFLIFIGNRSLAQHLLGTSSTEMEPSAPNQFSISADWSARSNSSFTSFLSLGGGYALPSNQEIGVQTHLDASTNKYIGWSAYWQYKKRLAVSPLYAVLQANYTSIYYQLKDRIGLGGEAGIEYFFSKQVGLNIFMGADGIDRLIPPFLLLYFSTLYDFTSGVSVVVVF